MTTDKQRELLEYAANACGYEVEAYCDDGAIVVRNESIPYGFNWNPLTSSADCAAMCAKLKIDTIWCADAVCCGDDSRFNEADVPLDDDPESAWRYAATMVAAKIGGMK